MKFRVYLTRIFPAVLLVVLVASLSEQTSHGSNGRVKLLRVPNNGLQPQAAMDERGALHLIYFTGEPGGGDIYYVRRDAGSAEFTSSLRVNSESGSAIATGTIRGAHLRLVFSGGK